VKSPRRKYTPTKTNKLKKQEYWKGLPPSKHASDTFLKIPGIKKYGPFAKYHFTKDGTPVFIYYN